MSTKSGKTTGSKVKETIIEADLKVTLIVHGEVDKERAKTKIEDLVIDGADDLQIKNIKIFQREV